MENTIDNTIDISEIEKLGLTLEDIKKLSQELPVEESEDTLNEIKEGSLDGK